MRILVICSSFLPNIGGSEIIVDSLSQSWAEDGHDVLVLNQSAAEPVSPEKKYSVAKLPSMRGGARLGWHRWPFTWRVEREIKKTMDSFKPDIAYASMAYPCGIWLMDIHPNIKTVISCEAADIHTLPKYNHGFRHQLNIDSQLRKSLSKCDGIRASSTDRRTTIIEDIGVDRDDIEVIFNGADPIFRDNQCTIDIRNKIGLSSEDLIILSVGNYRKLKGHEIAIKAFAKVCGQFPHWHYVIVGRGLEQLQPLIQEGHVEKNIHLAGAFNRQHICAVYQQSNLYLSASEIEGFPVTVSEAIMAGLPLLLSDVSGHNDVVWQGKNGYLFEVNHIDDLTEKMRMILGNNELRRSFSEFNQKKSPQFEWKYIARQFIDKLFL